MTEKIYYKKVRDLGKIFSATFGFIKQNFKTLYGSLLFFAGPFFLIGATVSAYMFGSSIGFSKIIQGGGLTSYYADIIGTYIVTMMIYMIGLAVYNVVLNRNILENEKLTTAEPLTIKHSTVNFWPDFWRILVNTLLLALVMIVSLAIIVLAFGGIFALMGSGGSTGAVVMIAIGIILMLVFFVIVGPILMFVPLASLFVCQRDSINIFPSIGKVLGYMKNNFWNTWVVSMVGFLTYSVMAGIAQIPIVIISMITAFSRVKSTVGYGLEDDSTPLLLVIVTVISSLLSYGIMVIYHLIIVYQYTSLEEKKEGQSIIERINQI